MTAFDRRRFLEASLGGAAALAASDALFAADKKKADPAAEAHALIAPVAETPWRETLFLSWRRDPTTTALVQWIGPSVELAPAVWAAPLDGENWRPAKTEARPFPGTDLRVYRAEFSGLTPGAEYRLKVGNDSTVRRFRTMPAAMTNDFSFVSGGDAGIDENARTTNRIAARQSPHFALMAGDLAYDNGKSPDVFLKFVRNYARDMIDPEGRCVPLVAGIGNHEVNGGYNAKRKDGGSYLSVFDGLYPEKTFASLDFGDYLSLVLLDTGHVAPIKGEQTDWLARTLAERQDRAHLIVANHVPAYPSHRAPESESDKKGTGADQRKYWCPLFERYNVDFVLEHHDHTFKRTHPLIDGRPDSRGVLYLGDGSWGKIRAPKDPEDRPYLAKVSRSYHMTLHRFEGDLRFHVAIEGSGRVADVCMTRGKRATRG